MRAPNWSSASFVVLMVMAATSSACASTGAQVGEDGTDPQAPHTICTGVGSSTLPGVCIRFPATGGSWTLAQAAAGIDFPYEVVVEAEIPGVIPRPQDAGNCTLPGDSGLDVFARIDGGDQHYCLCDSGLCAGAPDTAATIPAGRTSQRFAWTGTNWDGASDTNNPLGPPFPAGVYTLEVSAVGTVDGKPFEVRNRFEITLTP